MRRKKGFSILELTVSLVIFYIGIFLVLELFPAAINMSKRARFLSIAHFLAQDKMEEALCEPAFKLTSRDGAFTYYPGFAFKIRKTFYERDINYKKIYVEITGPAGVKASLLALKSDPTEISGACCNWSGSKSWVIDGKNSNIRRNDGFNVTVEKGATKAKGINGIGTDMSASVVWVLEKTNKRLWYYDSSAFLDPISLPAGTYTPTSLACDVSAKKVYVSTKLSNNIFYYNNGVYVSSIALPGSMGPIMCIATDASGTILWVTDPNNQKLWYYDGGSWYSTNTAIIPCAVACTADGSKCWILDAENSVYNYDDGAWNGPYNNDSPGVGKMLGIATDASGFVLWFNDPIERLKWYWGDSAWTYTPY